MPARPAQHLTRALPTHTPRSARRELQAQAAGGDAAAKAQLAATLPAMASQPPTLLGCVSEAFGDALAGYMDANPEGLLAQRQEGKEGREGKEGKKKKKNKGGAGGWLLARLRWLGRRCRGPC